MSTSIEAWWLAAVVAAGFVLYQMHIHWRNQRERAQATERDGLTKRIEQLESELGSANRRIDELESRNATLGQSITLMAELFSRIKGEKGLQRSEFDELFETLRRNLREQDEQRNSGLTLNASGNISISGDVAGRDKAGG